MYLLSFKRCDRHKNGTQTYSKLDKGDIGTFSE